MNLSLATDKVDGVVVIRVGGELDVYTAPRLREALSAALGEGRRFVLDLSQVHFIDSTALGVLVSSQQEAQAVECAFPLVLDDPYLLKIFRITGFDGSFSIYPQVSDAVGAS